MPSQCAPLLRIVRNNGGGETHEIPCGDVRLTGRGRVESAQSEAPPVLQDGEGRALKCGGETADRAEV